jgi:hypothetical protein
MYNGTVELVFNSFKHEYTVDGKKVYGVTNVLQTIAKPALLFWAANMASDYFREMIQPGRPYDEIEIETIWKAAKRAHTQKKEEAGSIGHLVHDWVDKYCKGETPPMPINEKAIGGINRFLSWVKEHDVKFLSNEQPCYSKKYGYAGTIDGICWVDKKLYIFDLKTSSGIWDEYLIQVAAYKQARQEEYPAEIYDGCIILRVGKEEGEVEFLPFQDKDYHLQAFLSALELKKAMEKIANDKK